MIVKNVPSGRSWQTVGSIKKDNPPPLETFPQPLTVPGQAEPAVPPSRAGQPLPGASIFISVGARRLSLYQYDQPLRQYPIAVGKPSTPTPLGDYVIASKVINPGGILGSRWMGLNYDTYGIHGTNKPWLIGQAVSLGCIRMHNEHVEEVYRLVKIGTPVKIRE